MNKLKIIWKVVKDKVYKMLQELQNYLELIEYRLKEPAFDTRKRGLNIGHRHHIIPKSINNRQNVLDLFAQYGYSDIKQVVALTYIEHFRVHRWLQIISRELLDKYAYAKMDNAWLFIANSNDINVELTEEEFEESMKMYIDSHTGENASNFGKHWSTEKRQKISNTLKEKYENGEIVSYWKGKQLPNETRQKISDTDKKQYASGERTHPLKGKHKSEESKQKQSETEKRQYALGERVVHNKGKTKENYEPLKRAGEKVSKIRKEMFDSGELVSWNKGLTSETDNRVKLGHEKSVESFKKRYANGEIIHTMYGKHHTESTKQKISNTLKEKYQSGEIIAPMNGKHPTEVTKEKRNKTMREKYYSDPTYRKRMSECQIGIQAGSKNPAATSIVQLSMNYQLIRVYEYIKKVKEFGYNTGKVSSCIHHNYITKDGDNVYSKKGEANKSIWIKTEEYLQYLIDNDIELQQLLVEFFNKNPKIKEKCYKKLERK